MVLRHVNDEKSLKGSGVRDYISDAKDIAQDKTDLEKKLLSMSAKKFYTPENYTDIKKVLTGLGDFNLDAIIDEIYTNQTIYPSNSTFKITV